MNLLYSSKSGLKGLMPSLCAMAYTERTKHIFTNFVLLLLYYISLKLLALSLPIGALANSVSTVDDRLVGSKLHDHTRRRLLFLRGLECEHSLFLCVRV